MQMRSFYRPFSPGRNLLQLFLLLHRLPREIFAYNCFIGHQLQLQPRAGSICVFNKSESFSFSFYKEAEGIDFSSFSLVLSGGNENLPPLNQVLPVGAAGSMDTGDDGGFASSLYIPY